MSRAAVDFFVILRLVAFNTHHKETVPTADNHWILQEMKTDWPVKAILIN